MQQSAFPRPLSRSVELLLPAAVAMHIPDGFLSVQVALAAWAPTVILLAIAIRRTQTDLAERQVPLMGVMAAFIFAAQMINFPVAGGTSGHLLGGVLAAITLGPWPAMLVMASVIGIQALLFQDGGLLTMGANILNMGLIAALIGYGMYRSVAHGPLALRLGMAGFAAWLSVVGGALLTSLQLWLSGAAAVDIVVRAMIGVHVFIGVGEAVITVAAVAFILRARPELMEAERTRPSSGRGWILAGFGVAAFVALLSPFASVDPDGLERVAEDIGFIERAAEAPYQVLPDYTVPFIADATLSTIVAAFIGLALVGSLALAVGRGLARGGERTAR
jgi:cobalt/nickel transport system permease protein